MFGCRLDLPLAEAANPLGCPAEFCSSAFKDLRFQLGNLSSIAEGYKVILWCSDSLIAHLFKRGEKRERERGKDSSEIHHLTEMCKDPV